jgi:hypothetical protein
MENVIRVLSTLALKGAAGSSPDDLKPQAACASTPISRRR